MAALKASKIAPEPAKAEPPAEPKAEAPKPEDVAAVASAIRAAVPAVQPSAPRVWAVFDMIATGGKSRMNGPMPKDGRMVEMWSDKPALMPMEEAMLFLGKETYRVTDENGHIVSSGANAPPPSDPSRSPPGFIYAHVSELTDRALLTRCLQTDGGRDFNDRTPRDQMIGLITAGLAVSTPTASAAFMTPAGVDRALGLK